MTEEIIIDVNECPHKRDDECMEVPICNEYGDLMGYQSCEAQTLCPYRSQKKIERLEQLKNKYYQQTLDDEITINDLIEEIQELKADVLKWQKAFSRQYQINENKGYSKAEENYRSALEEINLILDELKQQYDYMEDYSKIKEIQDKINEVLK